MIYPRNWPKCVYCGKPALDGHLTCGSALCNELKARVERANKGSESKLTEASVNDLHEKYNVPKAAEVDIPLAKPVEQGESEE